MRAHARARARWWRAHRDPPAVPSPRAPALLPSCPHHTLTAHASTPTPPSAAPLPLVASPRSPDAGKGKGSKAADSGAAASAGAGASSGGGGGANRWVALNAGGGDDDSSSEEEEEAAPAPAPVAAAKAPAPAPMVVSAEAALQQGVGPELTTAADVKDETEGIMRVRCVAWRGLRAGGRGGSSARVCVRANT